MKCKTLSARDRFELVTHLAGLEPYRSWIFCLSQKILQRIPLRTGVVWRPYASLRAIIIYFQVAQTRNPDLCKCTSANAHPDLFHWLGYLGSNQRMQGSKPCALPLGYTPMNGAPERTRTPAPCYRPISFQDCSLHQLEYRSKKMVRV